MTAFWFILICWAVLFLLIGLFQAWFKGYPSLAAWFRAEILNRRD